MEASSNDDEGLVPHVIGGVAGRVAAETFKSPFDLLKCRSMTHLKARPAVQLLILLRDEKWRAGGCHRDCSGQRRSRLQFACRVLKRETSERTCLRSAVGWPLVLAFSVGLRTPFDIIEQQLQLQTRQQLPRRGRSPPPHPPLAWKSQRPVLPRPHFSLPRRGRPSRRRRARSRTES